MLHGWLWRIGGEQVFSEFKNFGRLLFEAGMISSHGGNLSIREGNDVWITRTNSRLSDLEKKDIIHISMTKETGEEAYASRESVVHKAIYKEVGKFAVLHAHPKFAVALSLKQDIIEPIDAEGIHTLGEVPVISVKNSIGSSEVAEKIPPYLKDYSIVVVKGHGSFAAAEDLETAYRATSTLEYSSHIYWLTQQIGG